MALTIPVKHLPIVIRRALVAVGTVNCKEKTDHADCAAGNGGGGEGVAFPLSKATFLKVATSSASEVPHDSGRQTANPADRRSGIDPR